MLQLSWMQLSLLAAAIWAICNILDKIVISRYLFSPFLCLIVLGFVGGAIGGVSLILQEGRALLLPFQLISGSIFTGVVYFFGIFFYFKALLAEEVSRVVPLFFLTPLFVLLIAGLTLGETLDFSEYLGILLLICGAILVSLRKGSGTTMSKALWMMLVASFLCAISEVYTKYLLQFTNYWNIFALARIGTLIGTAFLLLTFYPAVMEEWKRVSKKISIGLISLSESLNLLAIFIFTVALSIGKVSLVSALHGTQPLFALFYALLLSAFSPRILKEEYTTTTLSIKIVSILLIIGGTFLLS